MLSQYARSRAAESVEILEAVVLGTARDNDGNTLEEISAYTAVSSYVVQGIIWKLQTDGCLENSSERLPRWDLTDKGRERLRKYIREYFKDSS